MDTPGLADLARSLSREEFGARIQNLFLAVGGEDDDDDIGFQTSVVAVTGKKPAPALHVQLDLRELVKRAANPYQDRISIGRARNCDIVLRERSVSKLHAHFRPRGEGEWELIDLGSQNGTRVNETPLAPQRPHPVKPGDRIFFGSVHTLLIDGPRLFDLLR